MFENECYIHKNLMLAVSNVEKNCSQQILNKGFTEYTILLALFLFSNKEERLKMQYLLACQSIITIFTL